MWQMASPKCKMNAERTPDVLLDTDASKLDYAIVQVLPAKRNKPRARQWMRFDSSGMYELLELDKLAIMKRASIPARDLRNLGPVFSKSSHILARERAMVVNLEFIKAIVTAEEVFLQDATSPAVLTFVQQLKEQFPLQTVSDVPTESQLHRDDYIAPEAPGPQAMVEWNSHGNFTEEGLPEQLPFEFRVLEIALDVVCNYLDSKVTDLECEAYPTLDEFTKNITSNNLELVRRLKTTLTHLTARVQKVRDELEQLLDDDDDMAELYLTRKLTQLQHADSTSLSFFGDGGTHSTFESHKALNFNGATSMAASLSLGSDDVEELEMLLEAYFMQLDRTLKKLMVIREYIDDTEDCINIQLDHQRNQLFQFQITLTTSALAIGVGTAMCGAVSMNLPISLYNNEDLFVPYVLSLLAVSLFIFSSVIAYIHWKGLFEK